MACVPWGCGASTGSAARLGDWTVEGSEEDGARPAEAVTVERTANETAETRRQTLRVHFRNKLYNRHLPPPFVVFMRRGMTIL